MQHANTLSASLDAQLIASLLQEIDGPDVAGIVLGGSYARGEATPYSDLDFGLLMKGDATPHLKRYFYHDNLLVSVSPKTVAGVRADIARPERAIYIIEGLRNCIILLDKDGSVGKLVQELQAFRWEPLQTLADAYASFGMMLLAELAHKVLSEVLRGEHTAIAHSINKLEHWLTEEVAVQRGVLIKTEGTYHLQVQQAAGPTWTHYHRLATGVDPALAGCDPLLARASAALHLYLATLDLLRPSMQPEHLQVAEKAVQAMQAAMPTLNL